MSTAAPLPIPLGDNSPPIFTLVDLAQRFGEIPATRICLSPAPGHATEQDAIDFQERDKRLFELVDGTLIEKTMGRTESIIAINISRLIGNYLRTNPIGAVMGADGMLQLFPGRIRIPDVSFISLQRGRKAGISKHKVAPLAADLAVEVISPGNSRQEMADKLHEYFSHGTLEVWYVYPVRQELHQYQSPDNFTVLTSEQTLTTPQLLPGFAMSMAEAFFDPFAEPNP